MFNREGELVACDMGGQLVAWNVATKKKRVLAGEFECKRFNAANDLVIDAAGGIYFTDPMFRAPQPLPSRLSRHRPPGQFSVSAWLPTPNGMPRPPTTPSKTDTDSGHPHLDSLVAFPPSFLSLVRPITRSVRPIVTGPSRSVKELPKLWLWGWESRNCPPMQNPDAVRAGRRAAIMRQFGLR
jgi:hypothetical protein